MSECTTIVDVHHNETYDLGRLQADGIIAVIHKCTEGVDWQDPMYTKSRAKAKRLNLLWGAYHFASTSDWKQQVDDFLAHADLEKNDLVAWDWERREGHEAMTLANVRRAVLRIKEKLGRYPVLYGGAHMRENMERGKDAVFCNCPLWYPRYDGTVLGIPKLTWPAGYTLWQYTSGEHPCKVDPPPGPLKAADRYIDRNLYQGTEAQLRAAWPFTFADPPA